MLYSIRHASTARFSDDLSTPGLHVPLTADGELFRQAAELGRRVIWLQSFGERFTDPSAGWPPGSPRLPANRAPTVPTDGVISTAAGHMPDTLEYDLSKRRLIVGSGFIDNVTPAMWAYEVSGMRVLHHWFSYRRANREGPLIGDDPRRGSRSFSPTGAFQNTQLSCLRSLTFSGFSSIWNTNKPKF